MRQRFVFVVSAIALACPSSLSAQAVSGVVTDSAGRPVAHARILLRPAGNASDAALRVGTTNARGEYRVIVGDTGAFRFSVIRIGFRPTDEEVLSLAGADVRRDIQMRTLPHALATVRVTEARVRCVPLNDAEQSDAVREWLQTVRGMLHVRRVLERDFAYAIRETATSRDRNGRERTTQRTFTQMAGDTTRLHRQERRAAEPMGTTTPGGASIFPHPNEVVVLSPTFERRVCFENTLFETTNGDREIRFRQERVPLDEFAVRGSIRMAPGGLLTAIALEYARPNRRGASWRAFLTYVEQEVDGESFPMLARVETPGLDTRYVYSAWARQQ